MAAIQREFADLGENKIQVEFRCKYLKSLTNNAVAGKLTILCQLARFPISVDKFAEC